MATEKSHSEFWATTHDVVKAINEKFPDHSVSQDWVRVQIRGRHYGTRGYTYNVPPTLSEGLHFVKKNGRYFLSTGGLKSLIVLRRMDVLANSKGTCHY